MTKDNLRKRWDNEKHNFVDFDENSEGEIFQYPEWDKIADYWMARMDEELQNQLESLEDNIQSVAWCDLEDGNGRYLLESQILSLIGSYKNKQ